MDTKDGKNDDLISLLSAHLEGVAREEAARAGFDVSKEPDGLFRAMATVMSNPALYKEALRRTKAAEPSEYKAYYDARIVEKRKHGF